jgi:hypothetical protein
MALAHLVHHHPVHPASWKTGPWVDDVYIQDCTGGHGIVQPGNSGVVGYHPSIMAGNGGCWGGHPWSPHHPGDPRYHSPAYLKHHSQANNVPITQPEHTIHSNMPVVHEHIIQRSNSHNFSSIPIGNNESCFRWNM